VIMKKVVQDLPCTTGKIKKRPVGNREKSDAGYERGVSGPLWPKEK